VPCGLKNGLTANSTLLWTGLEHYPYACPSLRGASCASQGCAVPADFAGDLQQVPVELLVLMDYDASISKDWMIYVYPSSYLVDHQGKIRYAYLGALEWDSIENLRIIRSLLSKR
jgi:hypothetical protein